MSEYGATVEYEHGIKRMTCRKVCFSATFSITYPLWPALVAKPNIRGEKAVTNRLSRGTIHLCLATICSHYYRPSDLLPRVVVGTKQCVSGPLQVSRTVMRGVCGVGGKGAYTVQTVDIICQQQYFVARCLRSCFG
jgi:hypothetical protein